MKLKYLLPIMLLFTSTPSFAYVCWNSKGRGVVDEVFYDISDSFNSTNNAVGRVVEIVKNFSSEVSAVCPRHNQDESKDTTFRSYITDLPVVEHNLWFQFLPINDYLIGGLQITDSHSGNFFPPVKYQHTGTDHNVSAGKPFPIHDTDLTFRLKVIKPFVDFVPIPKKTMFTVYVTTEIGEPLNMPVYTISYSGQITVPQSCKINAGEVLEIKFNDIPAYEFSQAGAGNKPSNVNKQSHTLSIQCNNIDANATLTLRLEAEQASGDTMVSSNSDIGFKISDQNDNVLLPNNINSFIPFSLQQNPTQITIKAWPVSLNGAIPKVGRFKSRGYLRIDFD